MSKCAVAIGKAGAINTAFLAMQILALSDMKISSALENHKKGMAKNGELINKELQALIKKT